MSNEQNSSLDLNTSKIPFEGLINSFVKGINAQNPYQAQIDKLELSKTKTTFGDLIDLNQYVQSIKLHRLNPNQCPEKNGYKLKALSSNKKTGFLGAVFEKNGKYIVVCGATNFKDKKDVITDIKLYLGFKPKQVDDAVKFYKMAEKKFGKENIYAISGSSLGGALAQAVGIECFNPNDINKPIVFTYNALGVKHLYKKLFKNTASAYENATSNIYNFFLDQDPVRKLKPLAGNEIDIGGVKTVTYTNKDYRNPITRTFENFKSVHSMPTMQKSEEAKALKATPIEDIMRQYDERKAYAQTVANRNMQVTGLYPH